MTQALSQDQQQMAQQLIESLTLAGAARELGVARSTLRRAAAGCALRPSSRLVMVAALAAFDERAVAA